MVLKKLFLVSAAAVAIAIPTMAEELPKQPSAERAQMLRNQQQL